MGEDLVLEAVVLEALEALEGLEALEEALEVLEVEAVGNLHWMNTSYSKGCYRDRQSRHWGNPHK